MVTTISAKSATHPKQDRSVKTHHALLDAAETLLRDRPWEKISTAAIVNEAGLSNGAIYGRFKSKDDLLIALYERHDERLQERYLLTKESRNPKPGETIASYLEREIDTLFELMKEHRWLLKAMGILSRQKPGVVTQGMRSDRRRVFENIVKRFRPFENAFEQTDSEREIELAVFLVSTIVREAILYPGPHFDTLDIGENELKKVIKKMALGFLDVDPKAVAET